LGLPWSGLGLEAQEAALARFAEAEGFRFLQTFTETESGADDDRPGLAAAIASARKAKAPIIVAKLDRLSRDVQRAESLRSVFEELSGLSARATAEELNRRGIPTAAGGKWRAVQVIRVRNRL
jgi:DNA invertase Pin-like site-specific DNA recombinase